MLVTARPHYNCEHDMSASLSMMNLFTATEPNVWSDFKPNRLGYQHRSLPGLDDRYFVAQQSLERFDIIEAARGSTRGRVRREGDGWRLFVEGTVIQHAPRDFQALFPVAVKFPTIQAAVLSFNNALFAWENPAKVTLEQHVKFAGSPESHRLAVMHEIFHKRPVAVDVLAAYPELTPKNEIWQMTREEFFNDTDLVNRHVNQGGTGYRVSYKYVSPGPGGPFNGHVVMVPKPVKGDFIDAMFGRAQVTAVSKNGEPEKLDNLQLFERGKVAHRKAVEGAVAAGMKVPAEVLQDYPDLKPTEFDATGECVYGKTPRNDHALAADMHCAREA